MVLFIVSLGLGDEKDITVRGLEAVKSCDFLYLEYYTSVLGIDKNVLEAFYGKTIIPSDRNMVETEADSIYTQAKDKNVGFLVVGDALCATTHLDLMLRAKALGIEVQVIHNTSVMGAAASCGLQLYQYGYTVSIPWFEGSWRPMSFYDRILYNKNGGMHTLCLLDIKVKEQDYEATMKSKNGKAVYLPPRFMSVNTAIDQLFEAEKEHGKGVALPSSLAVGMARLGQKTMRIVYGTLEELRKVNFGTPLHSLALCGEIHPIEQEVLDTFKVMECDFFPPGEVPHDASAVPASAAEEGGGAKKELAWDEMESDEEGV